jgi:hypothetical protein
LVIKQKRVDIDDAMQEEYDSSSLHGTDASLQADWEQHWQPRVDQVLMDNGW